MNAAESSAVTPEESNSAAVSLFSDMPADSDDGHIECIQVAKKNLWELGCHRVASFASVDEATAAINLTARKHGYAVVTLRSKENASKEKVFVEFACDRHGEPRPYAPRRGVKRRKRHKTRKCNCPMRIFLVKNTTTGIWTIEHRGLAATHNHEGSLSASSHPVHRRSDLTPEVLKVIEADYRIGIRPAQTLARLVGENADIALTIEDIYNARRKLENDILQGKSRTEYLLDQLDSDKYYSAFQVDSLNRLTHLFLAYKPAVEIYKDNPDVLQMDCTYKTNQFKMPLLNIVGVTGMNTTIHVCQVFLRGEKEGDYAFAMEQLKKMIEAFDIPLPQCVLVDLETALLNMLEKVFPNVPSLICIWHVEKNIQKHARRKAFPQVVDEDASTPKKKVMKDSQEHQDFCKAFRAVVNAKTEQEYKQRREHLYTLCSTEAEYVDKTWLDIWRYHIVHFWTNNAVHFGLQATSRAEGYHSSLKKWLNNSEGDLLTLYQRMTTWWELSIHRHHQQLSDSHVKSLRMLDPELFRDVQGVIHAHALEECVEQKRRIRQGPCTGVFSKTMGIPCVHKLSENAVLKPENFHPHWWIKRSSAKPARPPVVLAPLRIPDRRAARAETNSRKKKKTKGSGKRGTRRDPSAHEITPTMPPLSETLERTQETPYMLADIENFP